MKYIFKVWPVTLKSLRTPEIYILRNIDSSWTVHQRTLFVMVYWHRVIVFETAKASQAMSTNSADAQSWTCTGKRDSRSWGTGTKDHKLLLSNKLTHLLRIYWISVLWICTLVVRKVWHVKGTRSSYLRSSFECRISGQVIRGQNHAGQEPWHHSDQAEYYAEPACTSPVVHLLGISLNVLCWW